MPTKNWKRGLFRTYIVYNVLVLLFFFLPLPDLIICHHRAIWEESFPERHSDELKKLTNEIFEQRGGTYEHLQMRGSVGSFWDRFRDDLEVEEKTDEELEADRLGDLEADRLGGAARAMLSDAERSALQQLRHELRGKTRFHFELDYLKSVGIQMLVLIFAPWVLHFTGAWIVSGFRASD